MNIQDYILSGIIESYVLGLASAEERQEFEQLCARYAELLDSQGSFEDVLRAYVMEHEVRPPDYIRSSTEEAIKATVLQKQENTLTIEIAADPANKTDQ